MIHAVALEMRLGRNTMLRHSVGIAVLAILPCALACNATAGGGKDAKDKKFEVPKDALAGVVKSVDMKKPSFTITINKKDRTFLVDKSTEFYGPRGGDRGTGSKGLEDDCMAPGYEIRVVAAGDGKTAKDVYLPARTKDALAGVVKSVDMKASSFTITVEKKDRTFLVDKVTEFHGPKGGDRGIGAKGLEDDCMTPGHEIRVVAAGDGKTAKDVFLPSRKSDKK
jgi:hypothetical protein